jgi:hypothetical protein
VFPSFLFRRLVLCVVTSVLEIEGWRYMISTKRGYPNMLRRKQDTGTKTSFFPRAIAKANSYPILSYKPAHFLHPFPSLLHSNLISLPSPFSNPTKFLPYTSSPSNPQISYSALNRFHNPFLFFFALSLPPSPSSSSAASTFFLVDEMSGLVFDGEPLAGELLVGDTDGACRCWARERMLLDGLSERGWKVEGAVAGGGMDICVEGEMKRDFFVTRER